MQIYLAPLEGITTYVYRRAYEHHFGGVDRYFTPFIVNKKMSKKANHLNDYQSAVNSIFFLEI